MTDNTAPEIMYCAPSEAGGWADAHAGDWPSPANPNDTKYIRADLAVPHTEVDALVRALEETNRE